MDPGAIEGIVESTELSFPTYRLSGEVSDGDTRPLEVVAFVDGDAVATAPLVAPSDGEAGRVGKLDFDLDVPTSLVHPWQMPHAARDLRLFAVGDRVATALEWGTSPPWSDDALPMLRQLSDGTEAIMLGPAELVPVGDQAAVGYVETAGSCVEPTSCPRRGIGIISGWVVSLAHDSSPIVIAAFVGNEGIAAGTPGQSRPNVAEAFGAESDANLGFRFEIWLGEVDAGEEIRVFALSGGTATELPFVQGQ